MYLLTINSPTLKSVAMNLYDINNNLLQETTVSCTVIVFIDFHPLVVCLFVCARACQFVCVCVCVCVCVHAWVGANTLHQQYPNDHYASHNLVYFFL